MNVVCTNTEDACPILLPSKCVIYEGASLVYTGILTNDSLLTALQKIDVKIGEIITMPGTGTVTNVSALTLGTSGTDLSSSVANSTTTPVITLNVPTASATNRGALSSTDWSSFNGKQTSGNYITALTGDVTASGPGSVAATLATVNSGPGTYGSATQTPVFVVNGKGLVTSNTNTTITPAVGSITGLGTGVATALGVNIGTAGAFIVNGGALGTPSSGIVTNLTGTASININGTVGATTPTTGSFTTGTFSSIGALGTPASVFLTHTGGLLQSRTAAQVLSDIGGAASAATFTLGSTSIALGSTTTTVAGMVSLTSTTFVGALTGHASLDLALTGGALTGLVSNTNYFTSDLGFATKQTAGAGGAGFKASFIQQNAAGTLRWQAGLQTVETGSGNTGSDLYWYGADDAGATSVPWLWVKRSTNDATFVANVTAAAFNGSLNGNATTVTTNANLTGPITSVGNATSVASQTGTGSTFAMSASPTFTGTVVAPVIDGGTAANDDITIQGTSNATRTTSYVILQPTAGNVGIGTTSPQGLLHVKKDTGGGDSQVRIEAVDNSASPNILFVGKTAGGVAQAWYTGLNIGETGAAWDVYDATNSRSVISANTSGDITIDAPPAAGVGATYMCLSTGNVINSGATCAASLRIYKENETPLLGGLEILNKLTPTVYDYIHNGQNAIGFIADDVETVDRRLVVYTRNKREERIRKENEVVEINEINELTDIDVRSILAVAVKSIQEQQIIIKLLEERLNNLI